MSEGYNYENRIGKYLGLGPNQVPDDSLILDQVAISHRFKQHLPKSKVTIADLYVLRDAYVRAPTPEKATKELGKLMTALEKLDLGFNDPHKKTELVRNLDDAREEHNLALLSQEFENPGN